ncbi:hypothetical protein [Georgenia sp. SUBG003]|uniref:hypothetical protein n=1 Tax=Georgenia sp. SUBG003 TaxID=1497974 RepID=UPI003AB4BC75
MNDDSLSRSGRPRTMESVASRWIAAALALAALAVAAMNVWPAGRSPGLDVGPVVEHVPAGTAPGPASGAPRLIKYGQDIPSPRQVAAAADRYDALPFDGIVMRTTESAEIFSARRVDHDELLEKVSALPMGLRMQDNWLRITLHDELDWSDDALWRTVARNAGTMARALRESGRPYNGIWFDNEWYGEGRSPWDYGGTTRAWTPSDAGGATPGLSPAEAAQLVRSRGTEVMAAMTAGWPDLEVMVLFGPWVSEPSTYRALSDAGLPYNDISWVNELAGPFFLGMVERRGRAEVIDGGEFYDARSRSDYAAFADWQRRGFVLAGSRSVPTGQTDDYLRDVPAALAVYDRDQLDDYRVHDAATLGELTRFALAEATGYVWLYTEEHEWGASRSMKPPVPQEYVDAVAAARVGEAPRP